MSEESTTPLPEENSAAEALAQASPSRKYFREVTRLASTTSTNEVLVEMAARGAPDGAVVVADEQSAGRGRRSRRWVAPAGTTLLCSVLFRPSLTARELHHLSSIVGLAALQAARRFGAANCSLKWPNDLISPAGKLAGVLAEVIATDPPALVVGIGCNLFWPDDWPPANDPDGIAELVKSATTLQAASGRRVDIDAFLEEFLNSLDVLYLELLGPGGAAEIAAKYQRSCSTIGTQVRVETPTGRFVGLAVGVSDDGSLEVDLAGELRRINVADVVHLRPIESAT